MYMQRKEIQCEKNYQIWIFLGPTTIHVISGFGIHALDEPEELSPHRVLFDI